MEKKSDITMKKDKNFLIFTNVNFPYQISFDLNTGKYTKIQGEIKKEVKCINHFFANNLYLNIINKEEFPIYHRMIEMAGDIGYHLTNMGSVLRFLRQHLYWEQYMVLGIPINKNINKPLSYFPKDVLKTICRAIKLYDTYGREGIDGSAWHKRYSIPQEIDYSFCWRNGEDKELFFNCWRYVSQIEDDREFVQNVTFFDNDWDRFSELVLKYNYEYKTLFRYLCFLQNYEGYKDYRYALGDLLDYTKMSSKIAEICGRPNKYEKYPHFLKSRHDIASCNLSAVKKEYGAELFARRYNGSLEYKDRQFCIIEPNSPKDILKEAQEMHNCVASYIDSIIEGTTLIVFMRDVKKIEDSLVTVEVKKDCIRQAYQQSNTYITQEQRQFLEKYAKAKNLILDIL